MFPRGRNYEFSPVLAWIRNKRAGVGDLVIVVALIHEEGTPQLYPPSSAVSHSRRRIKICNRADEDRGTPTSPSLHSRTLLCKVAREGWLF